MKLKPVVLGSICMVLALGLGGSSGLAKAPSPNTRIVFHGFHPVRSVEVDGSGLRTLARIEGGGVTPITSIRDIAAAKNGKRIAVVIHKLASAGPGSVQVERIFVYRGNGSGRKAQFPPFIDKGTNSVAMSADGRMLAFPYGDGMYVSRVNSGTMRRVTTGNDKHPAFSKDGNRIVFERNTDGDQDVWVVPTAGGSPTRITNKPGDETWPVFSPSGSQIAYGSDVDGGQLRLMNANGSGDHLVTRTGVNEETRPDFSPGGGALVFISRAGGKFCLFTIRVNGTNRKLVNGDFSAKGPHWTRVR